MTATDETSEVWAVLKLFLHLFGKKERKKENSSLLDPSASHKTSRNQGKAVGIVAKQLSRHFEQLCHGVIFEPIPIWVYDLRDPKMTPLGKWLRMSGKSALHLY